MADSSYTKADQLDGSIPVATNVTKMADSNYTNVNQFDGPPTIRVTAPSALPGGYTFDAQVPAGNGDEPTIITVTVPPGGVKSGDIFVVPRPDDFKPHVELINAPSGHWKDDLFDCFKLGFFHPSLCYSFWCTQIAMGQIMQRMKLSWLGHYSDSTNLSTFKVVLTICLSYIVFSYALDIFVYSYTRQGDIDDVPYVIFVLKDTAFWLFTIWSVYSLYKTRKNVRETYKIPGDDNTDCLLSCCCSCCVVAQLARHTGDYDKYPAVCCNETGMPENAPMAVV